VVTIEKLGSLRNRTVAEEVSALLWGHGFFHDPHRGYWTGRWLV
jgi:hypothetical protein